MTAYLQKAFYNWFDEKTSFYMEYYEEPLNNLGEQYFLNTGFSKNEFMEKFIEPYKNLSLEQLKEISNLQSKLSKEHFNVGLSFEVNTAKVYNTFNALMWTLIQVAELNIFSLDSSSVLKNHEITMLKEYLEQVTPHKQCYFCSRPNEDEYGNKFNKRTKYCYFDKRKKGQQEKHIEDDDDCCSTRWRNKSQYVRNIIGRIEKKTLKQHKNYTSEEQEKEITQIFINFCNESFERNLNNKYTVQTENEPVQLVKVAEMNVS